MFHTSSKKSSSVNHTSEWGRVPTGVSHLDSRVRPCRRIRLLGQVLLGWRKVMIFFFSARQQTWHPRSLSSIGRDPPPATPTAPSPLSCNAGMVTGCENEGLGRRRRRGAWERTPTSVDNMCAGTSPPRPQPSAPTADSRPSFVEAPFSIWPVLLRPYTTLRSPPLRQRRFRPDPVLPTLSPSTSTPALAIMSWSATPMVPQRVESISVQLGLLFYFRHRSLETLAPSNRPTSVWPTLTSYRGCTGPDRGQGSPQWVTLQCQPDTGVLVLSERPSCIVVQFRNRFTYACFVLATCLYCSAV
jgi:hypothetical protein